MDQTILIAADQSQHDILVAASKASQLKITVDPNGKLGNIEQNRRFSRVYHRACALIRGGFLERVPIPRKGFVVKITQEGMRKVMG